MPTLSLQFINVLHFAEVVAKSYLKIHICIFVCFCTNFIQIQMKPPLRKIVMFSQDWVGNVCNYSHWMNFFLFFFL